MNLTDTHAHLYWDSFKDDFDEMIKRAIDAGISTIINVGVDVEKSKTALAQVQGELSKIPNFSAYSTIGIHPHESIKYSSSIHVSIHQDIEQLEQLYLSDTTKVIAIGECGLDFYFDNNPDHNPSSLSIEEQKDLQRKLFQAQIDLAKKLNLPLVVHCRDDRGSTSSPPTKTSSSPAWEEVLQMVGTHPTILHCYSSLPPTTDLVLSSSNLIVSFAGTITYPKNEYLREAAKILPLEKIVLETDCPFLPPQSIRGQRNEPANVREIAKLLAELKGLTVEEVANQTTINAKGILRLPR